MDDAESQEDYDGEDNDEEKSGEEEEYESMTVTWGEDTTYDAEYNADEEMQL